MYSLQEMRKAKKAATTSPGRMAGNVTWRNTRSGFGTEHPGLFLVARVVVREHGRPSRARRRGSWARGGRARRPGWCW